MTLPPVLASKFVLAEGYYIHRTLINFTESTETEVILLDGRRYTK